MSVKRQNLLIGLFIAGLTVVFGFAAWWTFIFIAFSASFYLQRHFENLSAVRLATFSPAIGWLFACLARDLFENGRISAKLASILHLQVSVAVYAAVFLVVAVPSFFAAYSGATASKAFR